MIQEILKKSQLHVSHRKTLNTIYILKVKRVFFNYYLYFMVHTFFPKHGHNISVRVWGFFIFLEGSLF